MAVISGRCPACRTAVQVPESAAGKAARCPSCRCFFAVPAPAPAPRAWPVPASPPVAIVEEPPTSAAATPGPRQRSNREYDAPAPPTPRYCVVDDADAPSRTLSLRHPAILGAIVAACVFVCGVAVLTLLVVALQPRTQEPAAQASQPLARRSDKQPQQERDLPAREAARPQNRPEHQQARENLISQSEAIGRAAVDEDHAKMAELTLPVLVEKFGGRAAYIKKLESIASEMKREGFRLKKWTLADPSPLVQSVSEVYAVVPAAVELSGPGGAVGRKSSYLIAVSGDGGASWKFIDGAGIGADRSKLRKLVPNFPDQLQLPAWQPPVWNYKSGGPARLPDTTKTLSRRGFTFDYPSSWTVDDKDKDYDPDHLFSIDASAGAMIMFVIADAELDLTETLASHVQIQAKRLANAVRTKFDRWGKYDGQGVVLRGKSLGLLPTTLRLFVFSAAGKTITVAEYCTDDEKLQRLPEFRVIEHSFRVLARR
jgi:hypothetical protein